MQQVANQLLLLWIWQPPFIDSTEQKLLRDYAVLFGGGVCAESYKVVEENTKENLDSQENVQCINYFGISGYRSGPRG